MFNQIFVNYLAQEGRLTQAQAAEVLLVQRNTRIRIGTLAEEEKLMTPEQVEQVNRLQASQNARFGDIAIQKGYLTDWQLADLLKKQPSEHVMLKQILYDKGYMTHTQTDDAIDAFKGYLNLPEDDFISLQKNGVAAYVKHIAGVKGIDTSYLVMSEYAEMFLTLVMRLIDKDIFVKPAIKMPAGGVKLTAAQKCQGDASVTLAFSQSDEEAALKFAAAYSKLQLTAFDEDVQDSLKEFLNCVNGLVVSELSNLGKLELDIDVPEYFDELNVPENTLILPFSLSIGDFCLFLL